MTRSSVRVGFAAACLVLLAGTPGATQTAEHLANVHVVMTEGPVAHPDGTVYFTDLANDRILRLGTDGLVTTYRQPANRSVDVEFEGDPPPNAPLAGRRVTLWEIPS